MLADGTDYGLLIVFEGLDGSGKSTQRKLLKTWLESTNETVVVTKWNSSKLFKPIIKARKAARNLSPIDYAVLHFASFDHKYETVILPSLVEGKIVLADRYIFTALARDVARGLDRNWLTKLYGTVRRPDIVFYFSASPETCAQRINASRAIKFYEAGQDVTGMEDAIASFLCFAPKIAHEYERIGAQYGFVTVNAEEPIDEQHRFIRNICQRYVKNLPSRKILRHAASA